MPLLIFALELFSYFLIFFFLTLIKPKCSIYTFVVLHFYTPLLGCCSCHVLPN